MLSFGAWDADVSVWRVAIWVALCSCARRTWDHESRTMQVATCVFALPFKDHAFDNLDRSRLPSACPSHRGTVTLVKPYAF